MMRDKSAPRVAFITSSEVPREALDILESSGIVTRVNDTPASPPAELLREQVRDVDGVLSMLTDKIDSSVMDYAKSLGVVANMAVGHDNVDLAAATERGIMVTNTPGVLTGTTADTAMMLILAVARRLTEAERLLREGGWTSWTPKMMAGTDVHGKNLGIYGLGGIGEAVIRRALGFGMGIYYHNRTRRPELEKRYGITYSGSLDALLQEVDFLTIHVPLTEETRHRIGARELSLMKRSAFLINTSRGAVVDEAALVEALKERRIAGAGLDVFETEPMKAGNPLLSLDNVVLTPHIGSASTETRTAMAVLAAKNLAAALRGEVPPNLVNKEVLSKHRKMLERPGKKKTIQGA
jgi:glyoxylate reductase